MDKELQEHIAKASEILEELKKIVEPSNKVTQLKGLLQKGLNDDATLSIEKKGSSAKAKLEGNTMGILVALVILEKHVLEQLDCPSEVFEILKKMIGSAVAKDE